MQEKTIETKQCKKCNSKFDITDKDLEFYDKISPVFLSPDSTESGLKKFQIPTPNFCPDCRQQRRLSFRNERSLYRRKSDGTGKDIISMYSPDKNVKVYENSYWWSDNWDAISYGRDFNFDKTFFEQFDELLKEVPKINLYLQEAENSPYSNFETSIKNCYLTIGGHWNEDCMYGNYYIYSKNSVDNYWLFHSDNCYECFNSYKLHNCFYMQYSEECSDCFLGYDLKNCYFCFGCVGLRNKKYFIFNKEYSKESYFEEIKKLDSSNYKNLHRLKEKFIELKLKTPHKNLNIIGSEDCFGNDIFNSKNCKYSYSVEDVENCKYSLVVGMGKDCMDMTSSGLFELFYEFASGGNDGYKNIFSQFCYGCNDVYYCDNCHFSSNLFGCAGLRNKEYCILNKQYLKEEYNELVPKIIEHMQSLHPNPLPKGEGEATIEWGEFFPSSISPFGYNETVAMEYYPISHSNFQEKSPHPNPLPKGEGIIRGVIKNNEFIPLPLGEVRLGQRIFNWSDYEQPIPNVEKIIPANKLPNYINDIPDDILNWAIKCEITNRPFKIMKLELDFYRKHGLSIPRKHPDIRHLDRMKLKNEMKLYDSKCDNCGVDIKTTYGKDRKEIVYCEECYNKEIY